MCSTAFRRRSRVSDGDSPASPAARSCRTRVTSISTAASRRAGSTRSRTPRSAHRFAAPDTRVTDPVIGSTGALHQRIDARGSRLKIFYTNTSAEYHRGDASLIHTDPDGGRDLAHGAHTRIYHFAGTEHGLGVW